jgi:hypothetical protein
MTGSDVSKETVRWISLIMILAFKPLVYKLAQLISFRSSLLQDYMLYCLTGTGSNFIKEALKEKGATAKP